MVASEIPPNFLAKIKKNTTFHGNRGIPGGTLVKNLLANASDAKDASSNPGSGRPHGVGNGDPLQYSCLGNSMGYSPWDHKESDTIEYTCRSNTGNEKDECQNLKGKACMVVVLVISPFYSLICLLKTPVDTDESQIMT